VPRKAKNVILVLISLIFYAWGNPEYIVLMLFSILFNYFAGLQIASCLEHAPARANGAQDQDTDGTSRMQTVKTPTAKLFLTIAVAINLLLLGFFKYYGFLVDNINALTGLSIGYTQLALPIGISFFTFSVITYIADVYNGKAEAQRNIIEYALYVSFFPKVMSGPIVQYHDMAAQLRDRSCFMEKFGDGARLFVVGLGKKVLIADCLNSTFTAVSSLPSNGVSTLTAWLGCITYTLVIYFDFSGYSDMAIGIAKMFGFDISKNFDYPYISKSATEFWRRWHISLGRFFRDYVYIPLGGNRVTVAKHIRNIAIVWLLTGFWHGAAWNFIFWGGFYGVLLLIEKYLLKDVVDRIPAAVQHIVALLLIMIGWVFFFSPTLGAGFVWLGQMFGIGASGFIDATGSYYWGQSIILVLIGAVGSTPLIARLGSRMVASKSRLTSIASVVGSLLVLVLSTAYMVNSTYSTFLYFKF